MKWTAMGVALFLVLFSIFFVTKHKEKTTAKEGEALREKAAKEKNLVSK